MPPGEIADARILLVDDQESNLRLLEFTLRRAGFTQVMSTAAPRKVTPLHLENKYDLILLDLQMPEMNGFEVMEELRRSAEATPVPILVLSADGTQIADIRTAGATFLAKPFKLPELVARVQELLKNSSS